MWHFLIPFPNLSHARLISDVTQFAGRAHGFLAKNALNFIRSFHISLKLLLNFGFEKALNFFDDLLFFDVALALR